VQRGVEKSVRARPAKKGRGNNNRHTTVVNDNIDKIYHVRTESSAKKWSQTRLPVTQRYATATSRNAF
jgi:hypothetical protein